MADGNDTKTKEQLLAEIAALKSELAARASEPARGEPGASVHPVASVPMTRREAIVNWIAPVILSVPVLGAALKPGTAEAGRCVVAPTAVPTAAPTAAATAMPSAAPSPAPSFRPTRVPTFTPSAPFKKTNMPIFAPTAAFGIVPPGPRPGLGDALAVSGVKLVLAPARDATNDGNGGGVVR